MRNRFLNLVAESKGLLSDTERRAAHTALFRILVQHVAVSLAEIILELRRKNPLRLNELPLPFEGLRMPADGTLVTAITEMLLICENEYSAGYCRAIWAESTEIRACWQLLPSGSKRTAERIMQSLVTIRNDGVEGHGIAGESNLDAEIDAIEYLLDTFSMLLPVADSDGKSYTLSLHDGEAYKIKLLQHRDGHLVCYRNIKKSSAGRCVVKAQLERGWFQRDEISYEADDVFANVVINGEVGRYEILRSYDHEWSPLALFPSRLTEDFTGRQKEIDELADWFDDTESRACMLYGDGGIGKTTLAVEFISRVLEGRVKSGYRPELITFYTAKKTRWGLQGLEIIRLTDVGVADVATFVPRALEGNTLDRAWYTKPPETVIQMLASYLAETWGVNRNNHLLILDNTETMATNADEIRELAKQIRELSRRVGRVLLTSRRRESIEARHIEIKPLEEDESLVFLRARGTTLARKSILDAGDSTLKRYGRSLGNKPLVLEVFVQALGAHGIGLSQAFDRVMRMQTQDLGEFLYSDAWNRMSPTMRHLLLLMSKVTDVHDDTLLKLCCIHVGISVIEAYEALEESRGIAQITSFNGVAQILLSPEFMKYCADRTVEISGVFCPTAASVERIRVRYNEFLRSKSAMVKDRLAIAYRHPYARAAYMAFHEGRDEDCEMFYDLAVNADVDNGWLYDRFAFFLISRRFIRRDESLDWAKKATSLIPNDPDAWFTRGAIESKLGLVKDSLASLDRAAALGKHKHLCYLQQAYAYANDNPPNRALAKSKLVAAEDAEPKGDSLLWKFRSEVAGLRRRLERQEL